MAESTAGSGADEDGLTPVKIGGTDPGDGAPIGGVQVPGGISIFNVQSIIEAPRKRSFFHNGVFTTLKQVVDFYNKRDLGGFASPEVAANVDKGNMGDLKLTDQEVDDLISFMNTLSDGYVAGP